MKNQKNIKTVFLAIICIIALLTMTGCDNRKVGECDLCGQTEKLNRFINVPDGEIYWYCNTCISIAKIFYSSR